MSNVIPFAPFLERRRNTQRALEAEIAADMEILAGTVGRPHPMTVDLRPIWDKMLDDLYASGCKPTEFRP
jgi:hypothetical protein